MELETPEVFFQCCVTVKKPADGYFKGVGSMKINSHVP